MNERKKTQTQKQHYAQHRELISLLFRFPKQTLWYKQMAVKMRRNEAFLLLLLKMFANSLNF